MTDKALILIVGLFVLNLSGTVSASSTESSSIEYARCVAANDIVHAEKILNHTGSEKSFKKIVKKTPDCTSAKQASKVFPDRLKGEIAMAIISADKTLQSRIAMLPAREVKVTMDFRAVQSQDEYEALITKYSECLVVSKPKASLDFALTKSDSASLSGATSGFENAFVDCVYNSKLLELPLNIVQSYVARAVVAKVRDQ